MEQARRPASGLFDLAKYACDGCRSKGFSALTCEARCSVRPSRLVTEAALTGSDHRVNYSGRLDSIARAPDLNPEQRGHWCRKQDSNL
jgi:hypothetical protein